MAAELQQYIAQVKPVVSKRNGVQFSKLLELPVHGGISQQLTQFVNKIKHMDLVAFCENNLSDQNTAAIIAYRLCALVALLESDLESG